MYVHLRLNKASVIKAMRLRVEKVSPNNSCFIQFLFVCYFYFSVSSKLCPKPSQKFSLWWIIPEMFCRFKLVFQVVKNTLCQNVFQSNFFTRISILLCIYNLIYSLWKKEDFHCKIGTEVPSQLLPAEKKIVKLLNNMFQNFVNINFLSHF